MYEKPPATFDGFVYYQMRARSTAIYPGSEKIVYPLLGLTGEVGEFANKFKKVIRDGSVFSRDDMLSELGDVLWYLAVLADDCGIQLDEVAKHNLAKLQARQQKGTLGGSGDNR